MTVAMLSKSKAMDISKAAISTDVFLSSQQHGARKRWTQASVTMVHGLAILGFAYLSSSLWGLETNLRASHGQRAQSASPVDVYPDTDYPLRPAIEPWDISTSYPYSKKLVANITEGTWLRITTHPNSPEIVFDMLGDLYCLRTEDSHDNGKVRTAHPILTGIPFDKEAEFSSDGRHLVFTSDAGFGVDNIWTMPYTTCEDMAKRAQEDARGSTVQQTNSTFRFFSSPAFHPTEARIIATKWFLTGRPSGAGEIWEFPFLENQQKVLPERGGRRLIERRLPASWSVEQYQESQLGSEQGRYTESGDGIIFSRHVKDDSSGKFSYSKDVHAGINAVFHMDLRSGKLTELVAATESKPNQPASPGGANMPRLSRDGRTLAFVRRSDDQGVLVLKDMRSGTVHYVWNGLNYDVSTVPAFMGAYPNYGWTSNDDAINIWAQGHIWKVPVAFNDLGERVAHDKPFKQHFSAHVEVDLATTRYSKTQIKTGELAEKLQVRALRGLRSNHRGDRVTFEAAGDNYVADTRSGNVHIVPKPADLESCYTPSFVHNTEFVLQACWSEWNLSSFHLADAESGSSQAISGLPRGRYISPISNGKHIAYVRTGKDYMVGDVEETFGTGVWVGEIQIDPQMDSAPSMRYLRRLAGIEVSAETRIDIITGNAGNILLIQNLGTLSQYHLTSGNIRKLLASKTSMEMTTTPNQRLIAFRDFQQIWLAPKPSHDELDIRSKPQDPRTPDGLVRLSHIGGHDVTFSGDGSKVFWLLGPDLYFAKSDEVVRECSRTPLELRDSGECARSLVVSQHLNVTCDSALSSQTSASKGKNFAIVNATLISMRPGSPKVVNNATVVVQHGRITTVGISTNITIPENSDLLNIQGGVVLPGFIDIHGHWGGLLSPYPLHSWEMATFLGYGITTIHNPASNNVAGYVERALIEKGRMYGPRVFHTGDVLYGSTQPPVYTEINSRADARAALLRVKAEGGDASFSVKNYQLSARSARQRLLLEAKELGMLVIPEGGWSLDWGLTYFIDGYSSHEHPLPIPQLYEDLLSLIVASGSSYTPLAVMNYGGIFGQHWIHQNIQIPQDRKLRQYVKHDILESLTEVKQAPNSSYLFFNTTRSTAKLASRGVRTNIGAHGEQPIGLLFHSEMRMMAEGGQHPYDVLRHATIGNAISLGLDDSIGSIEAGKLADLVIYPPGVDSIAKVWKDSINMKYVMRGGTVFQVNDGLVEFWPRRGRRQSQGRLNAEDE